MHPDHTRFSLYPPAHANEVLTFGDSQQEKVDFAVEQTFDFSLAITLTLL